MSQTTTVQADNQLNQIFDKRYEHDGNDFVYVLIF